MHWVNTEEVSSEMHGEIVEGNPWKISVWNFAGISGAIPVKIFVTGNSIFSGDMSAEFSAWTLEKFLDKLLLKYSTKS